MSRRRRLYWLLFAVMLANYLALVLWSLPIISAEAGGQTPFDLRPTGYDAEAARGFLAGLGEIGRAQYLGPQAWLDTAYPALLAATLGVALWHLAGRRWRAVLLVLPVAGAAFDYLENLRVRAMLVLPPAQVSDQMIAAASFATVVKSALATAALVALLVLLAASAWRRIRARG